MIHTESSTFKRHPRFSLPVEQFFIRTCIAAYLSSAHRMIPACKRKSMTLHDFYIVIHVLSCSIQLDRGVRSNRWIVTAVFRARILVCVVTSARLRTVDTKRTPRQISSHTKSWFNMCDSLLEHIQVKVSSAASTLVLLFFATGVLHW